MNYLEFIRYIILALTVYDYPPYNIVVEAPPLIMEVIKEEIKKDLSDAYTIEEQPDLSIIQTYSFPEGTIHFKEADHFHIFKAE